MSIQLSINERKVYDGRPKHEHPFPKHEHPFREYKNKEVPCYGCNDLYKCDSRNCIKLQAWLIANGGN